MNNYRLHIIAGLLAVIGLSVFGYKVIHLDFPVRPDIETLSYTVEARLFFSARSQRAIKARLLIPQSSTRFLITNENFISGRYGLQTDSSDENRQATWSAREASGDQYLYYRAIIYPTSDDSLYASPQPPRIREVDFSGAQLTAARNLLNEARLKSADMDTFMAELIKLLYDTDPRGATALLLEGKYTLAQRAKLAVDILTLARIPARVVHGLPLGEQSRDSELIQWVEVFNDNHWRPYALNLQSQELPLQYFAWKRGDSSLYSVQGGQNVHVNFSYKRNSEGAIDAALVGNRLNNPFLLQFSLLTLPLDTQGVYHVLLLLPLGALLVVIARNVIGVKCFGTFMPILIAIAFRETKLLGGVVLLSAIVAAGLVVRLGLERLKLLLVPRLAVMLTTVILLVAVLSIISHRTGLERSIYVALFPMVIITMVIERMSVVWDELGANEAIKQGLGSLLVSVMIYLLIQSSFISHLVFVFPELNLVIISIMLLLGRYTGYRLLELSRFRSFREEA